MVRVKKGCDLMKTNTAGIKLIQSFESCKLKAYKAVATEKYYTIGWGHYGQDVSKDEEWTQEQADDQFKKDLVKYENYVNKYVDIKLNENQFSALVSFCYNCGQANLKKLVKDRNTEEIADAMPLYNKSGGKVYNGLVRRRKAEVALFNKSVADTYEVKTTARLNIRKGAGKKYAKVGLYEKNQTVEILSVSNSKLWGLTNKGWICLEYTKKI